MRLRDDQTLDPAIERELQALDDALAGRPVGPGFSEIAELVSEVRELRETPPETFAAELDARATAGFGGRRGDSSASGLRRALERVGGAPRRRLLPALAGVTTVLVIGAGVVATRDDLGGSGPSEPAIQEVTATGGGTSAPSTELAAPTPGPDLGGRRGGRASPYGTPVAPAARDSRAAPLQQLAPLGAGGRFQAAGIRNRKQERRADLTLAAAPERVDEVADDVFGVVARQNGIVLASSVNQASTGESGAEFELLIPTIRLDGALAELSEVAEVRARSEGSLDITRPFVNARERLRGAHVLAEALLAQLADATSQEEIDILNARLEFVRNRMDALRAQLRRLDRRVRFSLVRVSVVADREAGSGGLWTIGDAFDDAGRVLEVSAGVAVVGAAIVGPLVLLALLAWLARRSWIRRARERALAAQPARAAQSPS